MKRAIFTAAGVAVTLLMSSASMAAGSYQEQVDKCLTKHANTTTPAKVVLQCDANAGKLTNCSVIENSAAGKGFDKAALCIADALPMAGKTGPVKIPLKFAGEA